MSDVPPMVIVDCTIQQLAEAMGHLPDDTVVRWYQPSEIGAQGCPVAVDPTYRLTLGQVRHELGIVAAPRRHP